MVLSFPEPRKAVPVSVLKDHLSAIPKRMVEAFPTNTRIFARRQEIHPG